jgi:hypothetical protein
LSVISIERIDVGQTRIEALVRVVDPQFDRTSAVPGLAEKVLELLPGLARHTCENGTAHGILAELADTETPHLFEHIACEIMSLAGSPRTLRAETSWDFERDGRGVYRVRLGYDDDLVALASLCSALGVVDWLCGLTAEKPDVEALVASAVAARSREG